MKCPFCGRSESRVVDSRDVPDAIRRRRECRECQRRFTTYERLHAAPLMLLKRDGRREPFDIEKLLRGVRTACTKRPLEMRIIEKLAEDVETELHRQAKAEIESRIVGEMVMDRLRELDRVAYIRFASVYRDFQDLDTFSRALEALQTNETTGKPDPNQLALIPDDVPRTTDGRKRRRRKRPTGSS